jgi:hypothetical protein
LALLLLLFHPVCHRWSQLIVTCLHNMGHVDW